MSDFSASRKFLRVSDADVEAADFAQMLFKSFLAIK
jgi:hypothetical protein